jgi:hypothetical protein
MANQLCMFGHAQPWVLTWKSWSRKMNLIKCSPLRTSTHLICACVRARERERDLSHVSRGVTVQQHFGITVFLSCSSDILKNNISETGFVSIVECEERSLLGPSSITIQPVRLSDRLLPALARTVILGSEPAGLMAMFYCLATLTVPWQDVSICSICSIYMCISDQVASSGDIRIIYNRNCGQAFKDPKLRWKGKKKRLSCPCA